MGGREGWMEGRGFGGSNAGASPPFFCSYFIIIIIFFLVFLLLVVYIYVCVSVIFPLTRLRFCLDTRLPGESRDNAARGDALVSKSDRLAVDEQSGR